MERSILGGRGFNDMLYSIPPMKKSRRWNIGAFNVVTSRFRFPRLVVSPHFWITLAVGEAYGKGPTIG